MWGELRKLRSNAAIRISLYILQGNRFAELRKLRSNAAIRISLYTTGKQICRIAKVAKQRSNSYIIITLQGNKFAELRKLRSNEAIRISLYTSGGFI